MIERERWEQDPTYITVENEPLYRIGDWIEDNERKIWMVVDHPEEVRAFDDKILRRYKVVRVKR